MKPMVVFLDFDGVLTSSRVHAAYGTKGVWATLDPVALAFFNRHAAGLEFVISSAWRKHFDFDGIRHILQGAGFQGSFHQCWCTPSLEDRVVEINCWVTRHLGERDFIVVDDLLLAWPKRWKVVQTSEREGMQEQNYRDFEAFLKQDRRF